MYRFAEQDLTDNGTAVERAEQKPWKLCQPSACRRSFSGGTSLGEGWV